MKSLSLLIISWLQKLKFQSYISFFINLKRHYRTHIQNVSEIIIVSIRFSEKSDEILDFFFEYLFHGKNMHTIDSHFSQPSYFIVNICYRIIWKDFVHWIRHIGFLIRFLKDFLFAWWLSEEKNCRNQFLSKWKFPWHFLFEMWWGMGIFFSSTFFVRIWLKRNFTLLITH